jgi:alpha-beta hydrolase superfamily lysophospholipase
LLVAAVLLCSGARASGPAPEADAFRAAWHTYSAAANAGPLQPGCATAFVPAEGRRRGAVLALHGFGGCPQQFEGLAPRLAAAGFDVLIPRLPGHGRPPGPDGREDLAGLPTGTDWQERYDGFVTTLEQLLGQSPGERVLVGFSAGGALALRAVARQPAFHDRLVLLAPLLGVRGGGPVEWLAWQLARVPAMASLDVKHFSPRAECETWQAAGRAGFCGYEVRHAAGLVGLARAVRADWERRALPLPTVIVLAGDERYVSNAAASRFAAAQQSFGASIVSKTLTVAPHEMLTPYENGGRVMTWLPELQDVIIGGVTGEGWPGSAGQRRAYGP